MLRLVGTERAVAEVAAVAEHVVSLTAAAAAFQLGSDVSDHSAHGPAPLVPLVDEDADGGPVTATLTEIRTWARESLGIDRVPAFWRALAHQPRLLETTWRKDRLVFAAGALDELTKGCAALAVAQFRQCAYWIPYWSRYLRTRCAIEDRGLVEIAGAVMHYVSFNTIAHGMRLEAPMADMGAADVAPGGRFEHFLPGGRPPSATATGRRST